MSNLGGMEGLKGEKNEQQTDRAENRDQNERYLTRFGAEKVRFFTKSALCLYLELCFLPWQGAQFQKTHEKKLSES